MNKAILIGNLGRDPEISHANSGVSSLWEPLHFGHKDPRFTLLGIAIHRWPLAHSHKSFVRVLT